MLVDVVEQDSLDAIGVEVGFTELVLNLRLEVIHPADPAILEGYPQCFLLYLLFLKYSDAVEPIGQGSGQLLFLELN